jgi:hypothetical protein
MSHLRPIDPETGKTKKPQHYTAGERISAVQEIEMASKSIPISEKTAAFAQKLADGDGSDDPETGKLFDGRKIDVKVQERVDGKPERLDAESESTRGNKSK